MPSSVRSVGRRGAVALGLVALALLAIPESRATAGAPEGRSPAAPKRSIPRAVSCAGAIQHPLAVRVTALDPVRRGGPVRLRVTTTAALGFERGEVRVSSSGGAAVLGASRAALRAAPAGGQVDADFSVLVPRAGHRFLIQFRVEAEGATGLAARGAAFNLLPDGPEERLREVTAASGERLLEVAARRAEP